MNGHPQVPLSYCYLSCFPKMAISTMLSTLLDSSISNCILVMLRLYVVLCFVALIQSKWVLSHFQKSDHFGAFGCFHVHEQFHLQFFFFIWKSISLQFVPLGCFAMSSPPYPICQYLSIPPLSASPQAQNYDPSRLYCKVCHMEYLYKK